MLSPKQAILIFEKSISSSFVLVGNLRKKEKDKIKHKNIKKTERYFFINQASSKQLEIKAS